MTSRNAASRLAAETEGLIRHSRGGFRHEGEGLLGGKRPGQRACELLAEVLGLAAGVLDLAPSTGYAALARPSRLAIADSTCDRVMPRRLAPLPVVGSVLQTWPTRTP